MVLCCILFFIQVRAMEEKLDELSEYYQEQQQVTCKDVLVALLKALGYHLGFREEYPYDTRFIAAINANPPCSQRNALQIFNNSKDD